MFCSEHIALPGDVRSDSEFLVALEFRFTLEESITGRCYSNKVTFVQKAIYQGLENSRVAKIVVVLSK